VDAVCALSPARVILRHGRDTCLSSFEGCPPCDDRLVKRFTVTIEGLNWKDIQELELLDLPKEGETVETRYGTCIVTQAELHPDSGERAGKIVCRLP
jgi:hypothetical protein